MDISGIQSIGVDSVNLVQSTPKSESVEEFQAKQSESSVPNVDEYIPSEDKEPIGLYRVSADEQGNAEVKFDAPRDFESKETTVNTDSVDREIKSLKDEQTALQNRLKSASSDEADELRRQLEQLSAELAVKDNDAYRKANSVIL